MNSYRRLSSLGRCPAAIAIVSAACSAPPTAPSAHAPPNAGSHGALANTPAGAQAADQRAEALLGQMTIEEKLAYVGGERDFFIRAVPRLGIPEIKFADGPTGCRNWGPSTAYPASVALAASFDQELAKRVGQSMARDCRARGVHVLLAPGVNLQRSPLNGRNFEYLGEDPVLAGSQATEFVKGVQGEGVLATVKHFAANNQEWDRNHISSEIDERTLRELYLPAFERVVREGRVGSIMSSYNLLNGIYASHHPWLLKTVLKQEWGFTGFVMSDWSAVHDAVGAALGGCDLEMPKAVHMSPLNLRALIDAGTLPIAELDDKIRRILRTLIAAGFLDREQQPKDAALDDPRSRAVALDAARRSLVLLKNEGQILPFAAGKIRRIALVGPNADPAVHGGSGSSYVTPLHAVSIKDALAAVVPSIKVSYHPGLQQRTTYSALGAAIFSGPVKQELFKGIALEGSPVAVREVNRIDFDPEDRAAPAEGLDAEFYSVRWTGEVDLQSSGKYDVMTVADDGIRVFIDDQKVLDDWSDHAPRTTLRTIQLTKGKHRVKVEYFQGTLGAIAQFGLGPSVVGSTELGAEALDRTLDESDAVILCLGYGQSASTNSLSRQFNAFWPPGWAREANLVEGEDSDRQFGLPESQLATLRRVALRKKPTVVVMYAGAGVDLNGWLDSIQGLLWAFYPGQEGGTAIAEALFGLSNPSGKLPFTLAKRYEDHPSASFYKLNQAGKSPYTEGLSMGYRGFDASGTAPAFPFGFGLSYSNFGYDQAELSQQADGSVKVRFAVKNTGSVAGDEIAQIYVSPPAGSERPPQKLEGYTRVSLAPNAEQQVSVLLPVRAFAYWNQGWQIDAGRYAIHVGSSSRDHRLTLELDLKATKLAL